MEPDAFALLGLPRRASLGAEEVRAAFQRAAAACHPDGAADEVERAERTLRFQQLNEASRCLVPVASRLRHLLALESPGAKVSRAALMDEALVALFTAVGAAVGEAAEWVQRRQAARTFLARAALAAREIEVQEKLEAAGGALRQAREALQEALGRADAARAAGLDQGEVLGPLGQRAAFLEKWQAQIEAAWGSLFVAS